MTAEHTIERLRTVLADTAHWLENSANLGGTAHHRAILEVLAETEPAPRPTPLGDAALAWFAAAADVAPLHMPNDQRRLRAIAYYASMADCDRDPAAAAIAAIQAQTWRHAAHQYRAKLDASVPCENVERWIAHVKGLFPDQGGILGVLDNLGRRCANNSWDDFS